MRSPYEIFEAKYGPYDPDKPQPVLYAVWFREQKAEYLRQYPEARNHQIDGNFYEGELLRFFVWLDKTA